MPKLVRYCPLQAISIDTSGLREASPHLVATYSRITTAFFEYKNHHRAQYSGLLIKLHLSISLLACASGAEHCGIDVILVGAALHTNAC